MPESIVEVIKENALKYPDRLCIADGKKEVTYKEYWECICGYALHLKESGIKKGDCVVVRNSQNLEFVTAGLAIQLLTAVFVPVEKNAAESRILEIVDAVNAKAYISVKEMEVPCLFEKMQDVLSFKVDNTTDTEFEFPTKADRAEILFTTGTTGKSKGIDLTHKSVVAVAENVIDGLCMKEGNVELIPVPLSHSHGLRRYYANMLHGCTAVLIDGVIFTKKFYECMDKYHVTAIDFVPAALAALFKLSGDRLGDYKEQLDYVQLGSAPIPEHDKDTLRRLLPNTRLYNFYGTTESGCSCILDFNAMRDKKNCIGRPTVHADFAFIDEEGKAFDATEENPGLLACAGDMNMTGYYKEKEMSDEIMINGYIRTQDLSYRGEDGLIYLLGRQGDVIITGGNKVAPDEIEDIALRFEGVDDCACVPVDHPILGKEPKLFVAMKPGVSFDATEIFEYLKNNLENYKVPKIIEQIDKIPRTYNGKISRKDLM